MSFNVITPNGSQPPKIFPAQNNTNYLRLQQIIQNDHQFNNAQPIPAPGNDGCHKQVTYINRADPASLAIGTNLISFTKNASDSIPDLWAYDGTRNYQYSWRSLSGTVALDQSNYVIFLTAPNPLTMPTNSYGTVTFVRSNASFVPSTDVYNFATTGTQCVFNLVPDYAYPPATPAFLNPNVLVLDSLSLTPTAKANSTTSTYNYFVQYRKYA